MLNNRGLRNKLSSRLGAKKSKASSGNSLKKVDGFKVAEDVISRRNTNGTIILMKTYKAISFYKIEGAATEVWRCFESPQTAKTVKDHLKEPFKKIKGLEKEIDAFIRKLIGFELLTSCKGPYGTKFPTPDTSIKFDKFGTITEFNLEKIESEVLNESLYLDVFAGSDMRLKTDVKPIKNALKKVVQLDGITHRWKKGLGASNSVRAGLVAQQVALHMPELVRSDKSTGLLAVDYQKLSSYLVESIKDLNYTIQNQDARIQELESRLLKR